MNKLEFKKRDLLSKAELKQIIGGVAASGGRCMVYSIRANGVRVLEAMTDNASSANQEAAYWADKLDQRWGYDCPDSNGNYEHEYVPYAD
jgi:hypothetical protein